MEPVKIDGMYGEGGGQIIRSAITLSCITGKSVEIRNIRKKRKAPGLRPQHLIGIKLLAKICDAKVDGAFLGSTTIRFCPSSVIDTKLIEDVKTAGSIPLILQVLIPAVAISKKNLKLSITGGTDVSWSPTSNYVKHVLAEAFSRIGIKFSMEVKRRGYYPRGGGNVEVQVYPCEKIRTLNLTQRFNKTVKILCSYSKISKDLMEKEFDKTQKVLENQGFSCNSEIREEPALNEGCSLLVFTHDQSCIIGSDGICTKGNQQIGNMVSNNFLKWDSGVDNFLSDMLVVPLSLSGKSVFTVKKITKHLETNLFVTSKITGCKWNIQKLPNSFKVNIDGNSES